MAFKTSKEEVINSIMEDIETLGRIPSRDEMTMAKRQVNNHFGTYRNMLEELNLKEFRHDFVGDCLECGNTFYAKCKLSEPRKFCSQKCANVYMGANYQFTEERKTSISEGLKLYHSEKVKNNPEQYKKEVTKEKKIRHRKIYKNVCIICENPFDSIKRPKKICSEECNNKHRKKISFKAGRNSAAKRVKRSKNEIALYDLLNEYLPNELLHNKPIFNGWDADIIIPDLKIAIQWNGPWHYRKITEKHSVKQVQNRDSIKQKEILKAGYKLIIVKDCDNKMTTVKSCEIIKELLYSEFSCLSIF